MLSSQGGQLIGTSDTHRTGVGRLYLVATPIGNLEDITLRALRILKGVDLIACEDTRRTRKLLAHYGIGKRLTSYYDYNKEKKASGLVKSLLEGKSIALVSDAGTPGISDPAFYLVRLAIKEGIEITPIPGPNAALSALISSGLPTDRFAFEGFLPSKPGPRRRRLEDLANERRTLIFYESPHRLLATLQDMQTVFGNRKTALAKELTKRFEGIIRGTLNELIPQLPRGKVKGEWVILVEGKANKETNR